MSEPAFQPDTLHTLRPADEFYITTIVLHNWQGHLDTTVHLVDGIVAFIGSTDAGKTSIFRILRWILENRTYNNFITLDQEDCWGEVRFSTGYAIRRRRTRSGSINTYEAFKDGEPLFPNPLTGFGTKVPPQIREISGYNRIEFNFANQLDSAFLLAENPASRARTIGTLEELSKIDVALTGTNDDVRVSNKRIKDLEKEIENFEKEKKSLKKIIETTGPKVEWLQELKQGIEKKQRIVEMLDRSTVRLEALRIELTQCQGQVLQARVILESWPEDLPERVDIARRLIGWAQHLASIEQELASITYMNEDRLKELTELCTVVEKRVLTSQILLRSDQRLKEIQQEQVKIRGSYSPTVATIEYTDVDRKIDVYRTLLKYDQRLSDIQSNKVAAQKEVEEAQNQISSLLNQFVEALHSAKVCPTCAQDTSAITCDHIQAIV